jgi:hypothetical protein
VRAVPVAVTENVTEFPEHLVAEAGWPVIFGGVFTVRVAEQVVTHPLLSVTVTVYVPALPVCELLIVMEAVVALKLFGPLQL